MRKTRVEERKCSVAEENLCNVPCRMLISGKVRRPMRWACGKGGGQKLERKTEEQTARSFMVLEANQGSHDLLQVQQEVSTELQAGQ